MIFLRIEGRRLVVWTSFSVGAASIVLGVMHSGAILLQDRTYDRDLVFLLTSGAILIFCGLINVILVSGIKKNIRSANVVSILSTVFLVVFCLSLTPFFKSRLNYCLIGIHVLYLTLFAAVLVVEKRSGPKD